MKIKWQEQVLKSDVKCVVAHVARKAGKTFTAIQWARAQKGRSVVYITDNTQQATMIASAMNHMYQEEVERFVKGPCRVTFKDGTVVRFASSNVAEGALRGTRFDALIVDDARFTMDDFLATGIVGVQKFFFIGTVLSSFVRQFASTLDENEVIVLTVDYLDLLAEGYFSADEIRHLVANTEPEYFKKEMGPFERPKKKENADYLHLLSLAEI